MSIKSNPFGGVELSGEDAKEFRKQVTYGSAKPAAKDAVARGMLLSGLLRKSGSVRLKIKTSA